MTEPILAIDIGGTKSLVALGDASGALLEDPRRLDNVYGGRAAEYWPALLREVDSLLEAHPEERARLRRAGVGFGGPIDRDGRFHSLHVGGWDRIDLIGDLRRRYGLTARVGNDANVAALGEYRYGAGRGSRTLVYLTVSTGIGGGVVEEGRLLQGERGLAGELGHLPLRPDGPPCSCGGRGCLEALASGTAIGRRMREALAEQGREGLERYPGAKEVFEAAAAGDPLARRVLDECLEDLARGLAAVFNVFDPCVMVLGGGVPLAGDALFDPLRRLMLPYVMEFRRGDLDLRPAALGEHSVLLGAVALALSE